MSQDELRTQEAGRHEEVVGRNIEQNQDMNLKEKAKGISRADQNAKIGRAVYVLYAVFAALEIMLGLRVLLHLAAANPDNGFARFIDMLTSLFVAPFATLLQNPSFGANVLEITTLFAMIIYAILAWGFGRVMWLVLSRTR